MSLEEIILNAKTTAIKKWLESDIIRSKFPSTKNHPEGIFCTNGEFYIYFENNSNYSQLPVYRSGDEELEIIYGGKTISRNLPCFMGVFEDVKVKSNYYECILREKGEIYVICPNFSPSGRTGIYTK